MCVCACERVISVRIVSTLGIMNVTNTSGLAFLVSTKRRGCLAVDGQISVYFHWVLLVTAFRMTFINYFVLFTSSLSSLTNS
jgi:hypothetical protein